MGNMTKFIAWSVIGLAVVVAIPVTVMFAVQTTSAVQKNNVWQGPSEQEKLAALADSGNQSAKMLTYAVLHEENSQRDLQAAELNVAKNTNDVHAFELGASLQFFLAKEVIKSVVVTTLDGRQLELSVGQVVRVYFETLKQLPGDSKL